MKESIASALRSPDVHWCALYCDDCGSEVYHSHKGDVPKIDTVSSIIKMAAASHADSSGHESFTLDVTRTDPVKEIDVEITIDD